MTMQEMTMTTDDPMGAWRQSHSPVSWIAEPLEVPQDFNGYVTVARPAMHLRADQVHVGDVVIYSDYVFVVRRVQILSLERHGQVIKFDGAYNIVRFPHEMLSVIRPDPVPTPPQEN